MRGHLSHHRQGQSLVTVAVFAFLLFLTMGLAIDGGLIYAQRRFMQNTADAACLTAANQVSLGKDVATATAAAKTRVNQNLTANAPGTLSYSAVTDIYGTANSGAGVNLTKGVEINGPDVRVALQSPANTTFMRIAGIATYTVAARAHCNSNAGGGALPIAVARYRGYKSNQNDPDTNLVTYGPVTTQALPQNYRKNRQMYVRDILDTASSNNILSQWPGWGTSNYPIGDPTSYSPQYCCLFSQAQNPIPNSPAAADKGIRTVIVGKGAKPNKGTPSFTGPIVLDLRNMFPGPAQTNYPVTGATSAQQYKDLITQYILNGYNGTLPNVGDTIAIYKGISAGQVEKPIEQRFKVGDPVTVAIYDGTVYGETDYKYEYVDANDGDTVIKNNPTGENSAQCKFDASNYINDGATSSTGSTANPAQYALKMDTSTGYTMRALFSGPGSNSDFGQPQGRWKTSSSTGSWGDFNTNGVGANFATGWGANSNSFTFELQQNQSHTCTYLGTDYTWPDRTTGARTVYLESTDASNGKRHARYAFISMRNLPGNPFAVYIADDINYDISLPGSSQSVDLAIQDVQNNGTLGNDVTSINPATDIKFRWFHEDGTVDSGVLNNGDTYDGITASVSKNVRGSNADYTLDLTVDPAAAEHKHYLRIAVTKGGETQWAWYYIDVQNPVSPSINGYVRILGYATFEITAMTSNSVSGRAISTLIQNASEIKTGMKPRLQPW